MKQHNDEVWKPIEGFEGIYEISNCGNVRSLDRCFSYDSNYGRHNYYGTILKKSLKRNGYHQVNLYYKGHVKHIAVHRLVANAFIPNPNNLPYVNHKDENKTNNHVDNLEWCTAKYNTNYGTGIERCVKGRKDVLSKPIYQLDLNGNVIAEYTSATVAAKTLGGKASQAAIWRCLIGKFKTAYGYKWKYK